MFIRISVLEFWNPSVLVRNPKHRTRESSGTQYLETLFSRVGSLSCLLQIVDSYMRMHSKAQVKAAKPLFKDEITDR